MRQEDRRARPVSSCDGHAGWDHSSDVDEFLDGLDIVIEECDSLDTKVLIREAARARHVPVLMATSDRGLMDVERFDIDPSRPIMHGLLGDVDTARLANLSNEDKLPYALRVADASQLSSRMAASLVEVGKTLSTWPQLSSEVALSASVIAEAVRRIGLNESLPSGRVRIDTAAMLDGLGEPAVAPPAPPSMTSRPNTSSRQAPQRSSPPLRSAPPRAEMPSLGMSRHGVGR